MKLLVFGKNGQVARCLRDEASGVDLVALGSSDVDLMNPGAGRDAVLTHRPHFVVNAAAYTGVDQAETEKEAARRLNADAPGELASAAAETGARFIHLSTDYVFNGEADAPYAEEHQTAPLNAYGATKLAGETAVMAAAPDAVILRTSWVVSEYGRNFAKTMLRLARDKHALRIVGDQIGGPTPARDIARALLTIMGKLSRGAPGSGLYHYQGAPAVSWAQFATAIFEAAGLSVEVETISTADYPTPARRPLYTVLNCGRIERHFGLGQPDWRVRLQQLVASASAGVEAP
ncbi:MAG: dTDP-4-dehydrorhamnose reductase [Pseudomonadota bacterium]